MPSRNSFLLALALAIPFQLSAQDSAPIFKPGAAREVLRKPVIRNAGDVLRSNARMRLNLFRRTGFEDGPTCTTPTPLTPADLDMHRSLFVHDTPTLAGGNFSLRRTLTKLRDDVVASVPAATPESIFRQFWDTQNDTASAATAGNALCSDNNGKIGSYPLNKCPRPEGIEASGTDADVASRIDNDYKPVGLVNRIDLADKGWKNCGEHRIVYGKLTGGKNFIIFEAVLPNPKPGCRSGCRDVIDFWVDLSSDTVPASRAAKLEKLFYTGIPGFEPVVKTTHYTSGTSSVYGGSSSGQIRTNQFLFRTGPGQGPWTLKEFKTFLSCAGGTCDFDILPINPKVNPYGVLWNRDVATGAVTPALPPDNGFSTAIAGLPALAASFQGQVASQVTGTLLGNPDLNSVSYEVTLDKNSAESQSQGPVIDNYPAQFSAAADATFRTDLDTLAAGFALTGAQVMNRAMANSCAGCHLPSGFGLTGPNAVGPGQSWPDALSFVHVDVNVPPVSLVGMPDFDPANFGGITTGHNISPALRNAFLPARETNLANLANFHVCDCVPKATVFPPVRLPRPLEIIRRFGVQAKRDLMAADKRFASLPEIKPGDDRRLFVEKKAILAKTQAARDEELATAGVVVRPVVEKVQPVELGADRVSRERLRDVKQRKLQEIVRAEPPRESITGSFRPH